MAMFGLIVSGRLVSTNWEQISPTNVVSEIVDADSVNHIVIFLTGWHFDTVSALILIPYYCKVLYHSLMTWEEQYILPGHSPAVVSQCGNYWALSVTINHQQYLGRIDSDHEI